MSEKPIYRQILSLALPLVFSSFLQQLYSTVDALLVGRYVGYQALAAVGSSGYIVLIMTNFFLGLSLGASITTAHAYGARENKLLYENVHTTMALGLGSGAFLTVAGALLCPVFLRWMNVPADVLTDAVQYLRIYFLGMIPTFVYNMGSGVLRSVGNTRITLYSLAISSVFHIVLAYALIVFAGMGIAGAAVATVAAQLLSACIILAKLMRSEEAYRLYLRQIRFHKKQLKLILAIGVPAGLQSLLQSFSNAHYHSKINVFGPDVMAGAAAFSKVDGFLYLPVEGFALAVSSLVGHYAGAGDYKGGGRVFRSSVLLCAGIALGVSAVMVIFAPSIIGVFVPDSQASLGHGVNMLRRIEPLYFVYAVNSVFGGALRGFGESRAPMLIILIFTCVFRIIWNTVFGSSLELLFLSFPISWLLTCGVFCLYYSKGRWRERLL